MKTLKISNIGHMEELKPEVSNEVVGGLMSRVYPPIVVSLLNLADKLQVNRMTAGIGNFIDAVLAKLGFIDFDDGAKTG